LIREAGISIPGESHADFVDRTGFEPAEEEHSDRVLDEDLEVDRLARRRRVLVGAVAFVVVIALGYSLAVSVLSALELAFSR